MIFGIPWVERSFATPGAWVAVGAIAVGGVLYDEALRGWEDPWWQTAGEVLLVIALLGGVLAAASWIVQQIVL